MIYKIRIVSDEVEDFRRDILIDAEATFLELKDIICESTGFDPNQMSSFFICNPSWEKEKEITMEDMGADMENDIYVMEDTHLSDLIDGVGQKMLYTFDYFHDRSLFLQIKDEEYGRDLMNAECVLSRGQAPVQLLPLEDPIADKKGVETSSNSEFFDDEYSDSEDYDDEDIAGFDELAD